MNKRVWLAILVITLVMTGCDWWMNKDNPMSPDADDKHYTVYNTIKVSGKDIFIYHGESYNYGFNPDLIPAELYKVRFMYVYNPALFFRPSSDCYKLAIDDDTPPIRPFLPPMRKK